MGASVVGEEVLVDHVRQLPSEAAAALGEGLGFSQLAVIVAPTGSPVTGSQTATTCSGD